MSPYLRNKKFYTNLWHIKKIKNCKFWNTWKKFEQIIPKENSKLLDIGCGIRPRIPIKGSYFLDISQTALKALEAQGGICHCGDAGEMPYYSNFFDFINASEVLEHIEEDQKVLREVYRVLKPKAHFSFSVPLNMKYWTKFDKKVNHVRRYNPSELYNKIIEHGYEIKSFYMNNPSTSKIYKNIATLFLSYMPKLALYLEEHISLPITEYMVKQKKTKWHTDNFVDKLENASGVIVLCKKI